MWIPPWCDFFIRNIQIVVEKKLHSNAILGVQDILRILFDNLKKNYRRKPTNKLVLHITLCFMNVSNCSYRSLTPSAIKVSVSVLIHQFMEFHWKAFRPTIVLLLSYTNAKKISTKLTGWREWAKHRYIHSRKVSSDFHIWYMTAPTLQASA